MAKNSNRLEQELLYISSQSFTQIKQLAKVLNVSEMTIRRDMALLENMKQINCVYGGVTPVSPSVHSEVYSLQTEQEKNHDVKLRIANKAKEFIDPEDVLFFDTGTTVQTLVEQITNDYSYTFISSSLNSLLILSKLTNSTLITPGGVYSQKPKVFYDISSINAIKKYRANKSFLGATGFELSLGITCCYPEDAPLKQAMIECSKKNILLIDSSKFGVVSTCQFAHLSQISMIITDTGIPERYKDYINKQGVELILV